MHVITVDDYRPPPGRLVVLAPTAETVAAAAGAPATGEPLSANERFHLASALHRPQARNWLACAFDLTFRVDPAVLAAGFTRFARRHPTLRTGLRTGLETGPGAGLDDRAERFAVPVDSLAFTVARTDAFTAARTAAEEGAGEDHHGVRERLTALFDQACRPLAWPSYACAAVLREASTTVVCGFDHCHADAHSLAIAAEELTEILGALTRDRTPRLAPSAGHAGHRTVRPPDPDGLTRARSVSRTRALDVWEQFLAEGDGALPSFPLPLGTDPGGSVPPQRSDHRVLLGAAGTAALEHRCRQADGTLFTGLLAATALAVRAAGAAAPLRLLVPLHTRHRPESARSIGWFTTVAPLTLDLGGAGTLTAALPTARAAFRRSRETAGLPLSATVAALGDRLRPTGGDVFMLSYLDYRTVSTTGEPPRARNPHHLSRAAVTDTVQLWFSRTRDGLFLRTRHPDTVTAGRTVARFLDGIHRHLTGAATGLSVPGPPVLGPPVPGLPSPGSAPDAGAGRSGRLR
ncbi:hypothetical protein [Kitasatospora sp. NPDC097691]|uniref:hypothetical protein n=1 Tax=Kitasatospora sp. NPDC097691 TaxID=3157231 RepID=UPI00332A9C7E